MGLVISEGLRLKSYNTPAAIAGVAPTLDYRFALDRREIEAISLTDKLTYTGATNGTFVNRAGLIERATTDQPRFDHGPASRQSLGLLVEEQRTNSVLQSADFATTWVATRASITANAVASPDGTTTADKLVPNTDANTHPIFQTVTLTAASWTFSVFLKKAEYTSARILVFDGTSTSYGAIFNLETGTLTSSSGTPLATSISPSGNGFFRCSLTVTGTAASGNVQIRPVSAGGDNFTGDGTSGIYLWGAQLEAGSSPSSYIPTTTTALTRPVDSAVIDGTGVITGTYTLVEKPAGCAVVNGTNIDLVSGFTAERVMVFPAALSAPQITAIRGAM
jgi:hypothetical protein